MFRAVRSLLANHVAALLVAVLALAAAVGPATAPIPAAGGRGHTHLLAAPGHHHGGHAASGAGHSDEAFGHLAGGGAQAADDEDDSRSAPSGSDHAHAPVPIATEPGGPILASLAVVRMQHAFPTYRQAGSHGSAPPDRPPHVLGIAT